LDFEPSELESDLDGLLGSFRRDALSLAAAKSMEEVEAIQVRIQWAVVELSHLLERARDTDA
jgi:hypothetical protein